MSRSHTRYSFLPSLMMDLARPPSTFKVKFFFTARIST